MKETIGEIIKELDKIYQTGDVNMVEQFLLATTESLKPEDGSFSEDFILLLNELGAFYRDTYRTKNAKEVYTTVKDLLEAHVGKRHPAYGTALKNLAAVYRIEGNSEKAAELFLQAAENIAANGNEKSYEYAMVLNNLGLIALEENKYDIAIRFFREVLTALPQGSYAFERAATYCNLGAASEKKGDRDEAASALQSAAQSMDSALPQQDRVYIDTVNKLAGLCVVLGENDKARRYYEQSLAQTADSYDFRLEHAQTRKELAELQYKTGNKKEAAENMDASMEMIAELYGYNSELYKSMENIYFEKFGR
ncbi:MAG: tetratricopeptide repeat protein [Christensenellaceae bacterium]|jgi:tetratricopeptide (TPR) repeat protein